MNVCILGLKQLDPHYLISDYTVEPPKAEGTRSISSLKKHQQNPPKCYLCPQHGAAGWTRSLSKALVLQRPQATAGCSRTLPGTLLNPDSGRWLSAVLLQPQGPSSLDRAGSPHSAAPRTQRVQERATSWPCCLQKNLRVMTTLNYDHDYFHN